MGVVLFEDGSGDEIGKVGGGEGVKLGECELGGEV